MLIDASVFDTLKWIGLLVGFVLAVAFKATPSGQPRRFWGLLGGIALALGLAFGLRHLGAPAVVVKRPQQGPAEKLRVVVFGTPAYTFQDGTTTALARASDTLVVNDGWTTAELRSVSYGIGLGGGSESIAPMSTFDAKYGVDYVGPDEAPPDEIRSKTGIAVKYWVTW
jgi:hypothetical protein